MFIMLQFRFAVHVPVRAWIAALIAFYSK